jgi:hypothetical protein
VTNREKLIAYLENFLTEKDDEQFRSVDPLILADHCRRSRPHSAFVNVREEKALLVGTLGKLEYTEGRTSSLASILSCLHSAADG